MDIIGITRQLGVAIQQDDRYLTFMEVKKKVDNDKKLQADIGAFNLARVSLDNELSKDDKNDEKLKGLNDDLHKVYGKVMSNTKMMTFNKAKTDLEGLINEINGMITQFVNGDDPSTVEPPSDCTGNCSGCSSCN